VPSPRPRSCGGPGSSTIENDRGLDARDAWPVGELVERQILEMLCIAHDDMHDQIMAANKYY
jgi:hypothetical protein